MARRKGEVTLARTRLLTSQSTRRSPVRVLMGRSASVKGWASWVHHVWHEDLISANLIVGEDEQRVWHCQNGVAATSILGHCLQEVWVHV
jgi:hypothetical protein